LVAVSTLERIYEEKQSSHESTRYHVSSQPFRSNDYRKGDTAEASNRPARYRPTQLMSGDCAGLGQASLANRSITVLGKGVPSRSSKTGNDFFAPRAVLGGSGVFSAATPSWVESSYRLGQDDKDNDSQDCSSLLVCCSPRSLSDSVRRISRSFQVV
jgi:hypothetical protein